MRDIVAPLLAVLAVVPGPGPDRVVPAPSVAPPAAEPALHEVAKPVRVDGDLAEWAAVPAFEIRTRPGDGNATIVAARARLAYDDAYIFLALQVQDDTLAFPERSWRFGDGFYFTVLTPGTGEQSGSYLSFGFSRVGDRLEKVVVNRSGEYFPRVDMSGVAFAVVPGPDVLAAPGGGAALPWQGELVYEIAIPWSLLAPAHPLLLDSLAINIVVVDRDGGTDRGISLLQPDPDYDTERTPLRRGRLLPLRRLPEGRGTPAFAAAAASRRVDRAAGVPAAFAVRGAAGVPAAVRLEVRQQGEVVGAWEGTVKAASGVRRREAAVPLGPAARTGPAVLRALFRAGGVEVERDDSLFVFADDELERLADALDALEADPQAPPHTRLAVPSARIRLEWLEEYRRAAPANAPLDWPRSWWTELQRLTGALRAGSSGFLEETGIRRLAHRSRLDGSLQPYSVQLPEAFERGRAQGYPVLVALHGSGVDESGTIRTVGPRAARRGWIVIAPQARGLSDWYVGPAEEDVLEVVEHAARFYGFDPDRVHVAGFSMGGYGAYRLALRHGERFRAAVVMAGAVDAPESTGGEPIELLLRRRADDGGAPAPPLLIVHGALDQAVPVDQARGFVRQLAAVGWRHEYREFEAAGHGDAAWWDVALDWLEALDWAGGRETPPAPEAPGPERRQIAPCDDEPRASAAAHGYTGTSARRCDVITPENLPYAHLLRITVCLPQDLGLGSIGDLANTPHFAKLAGRSIRALRTRIGWSG